MLLELYSHLDKTTGVLKEALTMRDNSNLGEPPLIKAIRRDRYDLVELMLQINREKTLSYDQVLCLTDSSDRNVLHHAVMKEHADIAKKLIFLDVDHRKLRSQKDIKGKTPLLCDAAGQLKDAFVTPWDAAREGNLDKLKTLLRPGVAE